MGVDAADQLMQELEAEIAEAERRGRWNRKCAMWCLGIAIVCSVVTSSLASIADIPRVWLTLVAAISSVALVTHSTFQFESKSRWWYERYHGTESIRRELRDQERPVPEVSKAFSEYQMRMEKSYPGFGMVDLLGRKP